MLTPLRVLKALCNNGAKCFFVCPFTNHKGIARQCAPRINGSYKIDHSRSTDSPEISTGAATAGCFVAERDQRDSLLSSLISGESKSCPTFSAMNCFGLHLCKKKDHLPVFKVSGVSTEPDREAMESARFAHENVNGRKCTTGLTVPLPPDMVVKFVTPIQMPPTPLLRGVEGCEIPELALSSAAD